MIVTYNCKLPQPRLPLPDGRARFAQRTINNERVRATNPNSNVLGCRPRWGGVARQGPSAVWPKRLKSGCRPPPSRWREPSVRAAFGAAGVALANMDPDAKSSGAGSRLRAGGCRRGLGSSAHPIWRANGCPRAIPLQAPGSHGAGGTGSDLAWRGAIPIPIASTCKT